MSIDKILALVPVVQEINVLGGQINIEILYIWDDTFGFRQKKEARKDQSSCHKSEESKRNTSMLSILRFQCTHASLHPRHSYLLNSFSGIVQLLVFLCCGC